MTSPAGPLPRFMAPATYLAARAYHLGWMLDVRRQLRNGPARLEAPVISVGNLTVGGTGKTPVCSHLVEALRDAGATPALALRGYGSGRSQESDEALDYQATHPWLTLLVGSDRTALAGDALAADPTAFDVLVLDDGFQHRRLHRDLDIVLVDAMRPGLDGDLLPNGWLREPAASLRRADVVIVTRASGDTRPVEDMIRRFRGRGPDAFCRHRWAHVDVHEPLGGVETMGLSDLAGRRAVVCSGLGNPRMFVDQVAAAGMDILEHLEFRDHVAYGDAELARIVDATSRADCLVTSSKDWVKLARLDEIRSLDVPVIVPRVTIDYLDGADRVSEAVKSACGFAPVL